MKKMKKSALVKEFLFHSVKRGMGIFWKVVLKGGYLIIFPSNVFHNSHLIQKYTKSATAADFVYFWIKWELWKTFDAKMIGWTHFRQNFKMIIWKLMNSPLADDDGQSLFSALWSCWGLTGVDWSWTAEPWRDREGCKWNRENHSCPGCMMNTRTQVYTVCYLSILRLVLLLYITGLTM